MLSSTLLPCRVRRLLEERQAPRQLDRVCHGHYLGKGPASAGHVSPHGGHHTVSSQQVLKSSQCMVNPNIIQLYHSETRLRKHKSSYDMLLQAFLPSAGGVACVVLVWACYVCTSEALCPRASAVYPV